MASNQVGLKELWGFSGVSSMGLIIVLIFMARKTSNSNPLIYSFSQEIMIFLNIYALSLLPFLIIINMIGFKNLNSINFYSQRINKSTIQLNILIISLLSVAGVPPFAGFTIKFIFLSEISHISTGSLVITILLLNLPLMMAYLRLISKFILSRSIINNYSLISQKISIKTNLIPILFSLINLTVSLIILHNLIQITYTTS